MVRAAFVGRDQGDIWRELQKLGGFTGVNASQLLEVATQVLVNCHSTEGRTQKDAKQAGSLAAASVERSECSRKGAPQGRGESQKGDWRGKASRQTKIRVESVYLLPSGRPLEN